MDYSEWELERQRRALAALLLGGGTAEDEDALREEEQRSSEPASVKTGRAWERVAGDAHKDGGAGSWEAVSMAGRDRLRQAWAPEVPVSAWEEILGETAVSRQGGGNLAADGTAGLRRGLRDGDGGFLSGAADPQAETRRDRRTASIPETGREFPEGALPAFFEGEDGGELDPWTISGGGETAGRYPERAGSLRQSGGGLGQDRRTVVQVLEETPGTGIRHGGLGDAALQAEDGAKALSLAVQRDARRYDGGFMIY